jgi:colicin import membrane protein
VNQKFQNVVPVTLAVLLHAALLASLVVVLDFNRTPDFAVPLALNATLVTENAVVIPPPVAEPEVVERPPPPQPDTAEQERKAAEQQKREQDAREEKARLQRIEDEKAEAERQRLAEEERKRKEAEADAERRRIEAEEQRQADIERQREENERQRLAEEDAARQEALDEESRVLESMAASDHSKLGGAEVRRGRAGLCRQGAADCRWCRVERQFWQLQRGRYRAPINSAGGRKGVATSRATRTECFRSKFGIKIHNLKTVSRPIGPRDYRVTKFS